MKSIVLIGMSGAGKTNVGKILAKKLNLPFYDSDNEIEKKQKLTVKEIFSQYGETFFRKLETEIIKNIVQDNVIISTGGGAFENKTTRDLLLENSIVIYLCATDNEIYNRLKNTKDRPLLQNNPQEQIKILLNKREKNYKLAQFTVLTDNKTIEQIADEIIKCVNLK